MLIFNYVEPPPVHVSTHPLDYFCCRRHVVPGRDDGRGQVQTRLRGDLHGTGQKPIYQCGARNTLAFLQDLKGIILDVQRLKACIYVPIWFFNIFLMCAGG